MSENYENETMETMPEETSVDTTGYDAPVVDSDENSGNGIVGIVIGSAIAAATIGIAAWKKHKAKKDETDDEPKKEKKKKPKVRWKLVKCVEGEAVEDDGEVIDGVAKEVADEEATEEK